MDILINQLKTALNSAVSEFFWWFVIFALSIYFKNLGESLVYRITCWLINEYKPDEEVILFGRKARIVRITFNKTFFYMYDTNAILSVPNSQLNSLRCEKPLSNNLKEKNSLDSLHN
jgi:hypothetical protein